MDYEGQSLGGVTNRDGMASLGKLGVGFYRLEPEGGGNWISLGVVAPLRQPTPLTSPIAMDVAMAWFYSKDRMDAVAAHGGQLGGRGPQSAARRRVGPPGG